MKTLTNRLLILTLCIPLLFSCKKDPDYCSTDWATELQNEILAIQTALSVYYMDPSDENCIALKDAYQSYIDALKPYGKCANLTGPSRDEWQDALDEAEANIDDIC